MKMGCIDVLKISAGSIWKARVAESQYYTVNICGSIQNCTDFLDSIRTVLVPVAMICHP